VSHKAPSLPPWVEPYLPGFHDLLHLIDLAGGFVLVPLSIPGPDVAVALADWLSAKGHPAIVIQPEDDLAWEHLTAALLAARPAKGGVVMVIGSREPLPGGSHLGMRLVNEHRDSLVRHLGCPLLWCGPTSFLDFTWERAPDFWSIRSVDRQLEPEATKVAHRELDAINDWMAEAKEQGDTKSAARLALKRADKLIEEGAFADAAAVVNEAIVSLGETEPWLRVELGLRQVDLARRGGALKSALRTLDELKALARKPAQVSRMYLARGRVLEAMGWFGDADEAYQKAIDGAKAMDDLALKARAILRLGSMWAIAKPSSSVSRLIAPEREIARRLGDDALAAMAAAIEAIVAVAHYDKLRAGALLAEAYALRDASRGALTALDPGELDEALEAAERAMVGAAASEPAISREIAEALSPSTRERPFEPPRPGARYDSDFYVHRENQERIALNALQHPGSPVLLWGPDLFGKSTLLGYLTEVLRESGSAQVAYVNLQAMIEPALRSSGEYLVRFADDLAVQLNAPPVKWGGSGSVAYQLARWMEDRILPEARDRFVLILDGAEAVQQTGFREAFFSLLRAWSERGDGKSVWARFRLVLASNLAPYALTHSESISPFANVVTAIELGELDEHQAAELAGRYHVSATRDDLARLRSLVAGHPYLLAAALFAAASRRAALAALLDDSAALSEAFGPHLERLQRRVAADPDLCAAVHQLISEPATRIDKAAYEKLRSLGLVVRERRSSGGYRFRCALYEDCFRSQGQPFQGQPG
jgi:AAA-like domain